MESRMQRASLGGRSSSGAIVTGTVSVNVVCFTGATGNNAILTVLITPTGDSTVSVSAPGQSTVTCTSNCTLPFTVGAGPITLTAAGSNGHSFVNWAGCALSSPNQCTIQTLDADLTVTANFQ